MTDYLPCRLCAKPCGTAPAVFCSAACATTWNNVERDDATLAELVADNVKNAGVRRPLLAGTFSSEPYTREEVDELRKRLAGEFSLPFQALVDSVPRALATITALENRVTEELAATRRAVQTEREACALACDLIRENTVSTDGDLVADACADAIRKRGER